MLSDYCETLQNPSNGQVTYDRNPIDQGYPFYTKATYSCNNGYELNGGSSPRECETYGNWFGTAPQCTQSK